MILFLCAPAVLINLEKVSIKRIQKSLWSIAMNIFRWASKDELARSLVTDGAFTTEQLENVSFYLSCCTFTCATCSTRTSSDTSCMYNVWVHLMQTSYCWLTKWVWLVATEDELVSQPKEAKVPESESVKWKCESKSVKVKLKLWTCESESVKVWKWKSESESVKV